jgi:hypothetical protein
MEQFASENRARNVSIESNDSYNQMNLRSHDNQSVSTEDEIFPSSVETNASSLKKSDSLSSLKKETGRSRNISFRLKGRQESNKSHHEEDFGRAHSLDELFHHWNVLLDNKKLDEEFKREYEVSF